MGVAENDGAGGRGAGSGGLLCRLSCVVIVQREEKIIYMYKL